MKTEVIVALVGFSGVVVGSISGIAGQLLVNWAKERSNRSADKKRKELLLKMLKTKKYTWRNLNRLMHVIGADEETTKRLLLEIGARASEDGKDLWGLVSRNPFEEKQ